MNSSLLSRDNEVQHLRAFLKGLPYQPRMGDFEEQLQLHEIRSTMRIWRSADKIIAFTYVDSGNNLRFAVSPGHRTDHLEHEILDWGLECMRQRNARLGQERTLDASCDANDLISVAFFKKYGFQPESVRTLEYSISLKEPVSIFPFPTGFSLRCSTGESEVQALVALHRAAFGTENMTIDERLAIMRAPNYVPDLDLVVTAPTGELSAFCICGFEEGDDQRSYTDPVGVHRNYQRLGLGKAILTTGLRYLQQRGAISASLGTSSENIPMQKLAKSVGFICVSENLWFSKAVS